MAQDKICYTPLFLENTFGHTILTPPYLLMSCVVFPQCQQILISRKGPLHWSQQECWLGHKSHVWTFSLFSAYAAMSLREALLRGYKSSNFL